MRSGKFKNINCGCALVNGIVFSSVYAAETYCTREGLDVNMWIEADSPEVLSCCHQIAKISLPGLRLLKDTCLAEFYLLSDDVAAKTKARDVAESKHELEWEVHNGWVDRAGGAVSGFYDCMKYIDRYIETLERILRIKL